MIRNPQSLLEGEKKLKSVSEIEIQNLKIINEFLLIYKLLEKTRTLYGIPSGNIFIQSLKDSIKTVYEEFQTIYIEQLYAPSSSVLQKLEDFELKEQAFKFNEKISNILNLKEIEKLDDFFLSKTIDLENNFERLSSFIQDFQRTSDFGSNSKNTLLFKTEPLEEEKMKKNRESIQYEGNSANKIRMETFGYKKPPNEKRFLIENRRQPWSREDFKSENKQLEEFNKELNRKFESLR